MESSYLVIHPSSSPTEQGLTLLSGRNTSCSLVTRSLKRFPNPKDTNEFLKLSLNVLY